MLQLLQMLQRFLARRNKNFSPLSARRTGNKKGRPIEGGHHYEGKIEISVLNNPCRIGA